ncbi:RNA polymerase sigma factor [Pontimicrobium sp. IMCC45349]|uniref:RNA polymerase sigma factor n=1 Tax=Pontimicrobium sp. IMCC45349 TaxID=3391574 RepID=UPI00399F8F38
MTLESENSKKLKNFFNDEYSSLKAYVNSRIKATASRDAEDIIQDVALKLFTGADRYSPINNVAGFVYNSIKNRIIDIMRSNRPQKQNSNDFKLQELAEVLYENTEDVYPEAIKKELKQAILSLKPSYRDIIIAIDFEGYTYKEVSSETGIPEGTLMSQRHRAIAILYKKLETKHIN